MRRLIFALVGYAVAQYLNGKKEPQPEAAKTPRRRTASAKAHTSKAA